MATNTTQVETTPLAPTITRGINVDGKVKTDITRYSLFAGGLDMTNASLASLDPMITGYGRIFMVKKPQFLQVSEYSEDLTIYKHIIEYGNTSVTGINDITVDTDSLSGGYSGKPADIVTSTKDDTSTFTIKVYEYSGSPIRKINHLWLTGIADTISGVTTYHDVDLTRQQSNHTAEFVYLSTDRSGMNVEYACLFANCFPKSVKEDQFNYEAGDHRLVQVDLEFACTKYESIAINNYAQQLLDKYRILRNSLNFNPGLAGATVEGSTSTRPSRVPDEKINDKLGQLDTFKNIAGAVGSLLGVKDLGAGLNLGNVGTSGTYTPKSITL